MRSYAEANLAALIESTEDHVWSVDLDFRLSIFNRTFQRYVEQIYGIQLVVGMRLEDMFPPERAALWPSLFRKVLAEGPFKTEYVLLNGCVLDLAFNPILLDGKMTGVSIFGKDITERRLADAQLRASAEALREAQAIGGLGSYVLDIPTTTWTSSDVMDEIFGIDRNYDHTLAGWTALIHPDDRVMINDYFVNEVIGLGKPFDREYRVFRQTDNAERWVHGMGKLSFDAEGRPMTMCGVIKDITERKQSEMQLRDSENRFRSTFEQAAVGIFHTAFDGRILRCNARFAEIIGYPSDEIPGMTFQQITTAEDIAESNQVLQRMLSGTTEAAILEKRYIRKDGSLTWVKLTISTQRDAEGRGLHYIAVVEDVNDRKAAEQSLATTGEILRVTEERYRTVFQTSPDLIAISRLSDGTYVDANKAFYDCTGFGPSEIIGRTSVELNVWADPRDRQNFVKLLAQSSSCRDLEARFRKKSGEIFSGLVSAAALEIDGVSCIVSITKDISGAKAAEDQIRNLAFYDPLTHLPNRRLLLERLQQTLSADSQNRHKQALLFVDLDNFKTLNDTLGHEAGDLFLLEVAQRLSSCIGHADTVARFGADEFVVLLEDLGEIREEAAARAQAVGEYILVKVAQPFLLHGHECHSTASIGVTVFGTQEEGALDVFQQADIAMHQAKLAGRNTIRIFAPALQAAVNARAAMEEDLQQAIRTNQFVLYYQPQVEYSRLIGAEALIRWNHPKRGILGPGEFIPLAEETGLIQPLGEWVMDAACLQLAKWAESREAAHIPIAVNISARQFREPEFVQKVLAALQRTGADPKNLKLELTESMLADDIEEVISKMTYLKAFGLRFSLDDFGTGYSSLAYLKRLPLDQLKIDRSFVHDILVDASSGAIAQTIISLSRAMGLPVIAEGIETEEQRDFLSRLGCHSFQGFLFARPLPLAEFERLWLGEAVCAEQASSL